MKLPEPYLYCDDEGECIGPETFKYASVKDGWEPLYSEAQVKELLAEADKDFSDGMTVVHLQVADQMKRRYEPVLRLALEDLAPIAYNTTDDPRGLAYKAIDRIKKVLG